MVSFVKELEVRVRKKLNNQFIRNLGWLTGSQLIEKVLRLAATVVIARYLTKYDYGLVAMIMTTYEFTQVFTKIGIGGKLIQVEKHRLDELCNSAYWLNWVLSVSLFVIQCIASFGVAWFCDAPQLVLPICALATVYLITPVGRIQATLIQRENRMKITATINTLKMVLSNAIAAVFAVFGLGMWSLVLGKILVTPIDFIISLRCHPWRVSRKFTTEHWGEIFTFGRGILGAALLGKLRDQLDYLIIARFLGIEQLGIYYFAFNAGLGISQSIIQSIAVALYPHLCSLRFQWSQFKKRYFSSLKTISFIVIPFVLTQSILAPFYVPIVFGQKWIVAIPVLVLICLSAIPRAFALPPAQLLIVIGKTDLNLLWGGAFTLIFTIGLLIGVQWQAIGVAWSVLIIHVIYVPWFLLWSTNFVFNKLKFTQAEPTVETNPEEEAPAVNERELLPAKFQLDNFWP
ncbi:MAG: lipopolysaccharide biosynthesis protein [Symploca sp. SIO3C6]|uniref:Lipopolysaccharide biosynthesis protein n=1 Tax=Symploca sp. SIO1C4 TaxID=2607765 RepID=A0A6B3NLN2_9CYAN|nr:lipopolysaccharide biosynthesis protein [Symploca sp. SIO3C6]NER30481.1 lipopolysaccharide biosynthesis protein [Symploca sp. SIO1C4]NET06156.1 lipopolysaccharide biosynthesis protein [Symploca sp. SIO2B6]